ncbi:MAG: hypothetical protein ACLTXR_04180 [Clostridia bacterium]
MEVFNLFNSHNVHSIYAVGNESNKYELGYKEGIVIKIFNMTKGSL